MAFSKTLFAISGFAAFCNAHVKLFKPTPYMIPGIDKFKMRNPLDASGANFPCQLSAGSALQMVGGPNVMELGSTQPLAFQGSAVHGGGSCQISLTTDVKPNKKSVWKVIHSIEGGCPAQGQTGNFPDEELKDSTSYSFNVPENIPTGNYTLAWTWFNKIGNREMYMNCAPATLTGNSGDKTNFNILPDMFVANIGNGCGTVEPSDVEFPSPGDSVERLNGATKAFLAPTGNCQAESGDFGGSGGPTSTAQSAAVSATPAETPVTGLPGGVFVTAVSETAQSSSINAPATTVSTTSAAHPTSTGGSTGGSASGSTGGSASSLSDALTGSCDTEGEWNCIRGTSFQQCASGHWSVAMSVAIGTSCSAGRSATIKIVAISQEARRNDRFSRMFRA